jgi:chemotaxis protein histidine kinase CheA
VGEPPKQTYKRHYEFDRWPLESASDLADYAEWLTDLVRQATETEPRAELRLNVLSRSHEPPVPVEELRERLDEFPLDKLYEGTLVAITDELSLTLELKDHVLGTRETLVTVTGTDKDAVNRIRQTVQEEGEARVEAEDRRQADAAAKKKAEVEAARQKEVFGIGDPNVARDIIEADAKRRREMERRPAPRSKKPPAPSPAPRQSPAEDRTLWQAIKDVDNLVLLVGGFVFAVASGLTVALIVSA